MLTKFGKWTGQRPFVSHVFDRAFKDEISQPFWCLVPACVKMTIQKPEVLDLDAFRWTVLQSDNTNFHYRVRSLLRENVPKS